MGFLKKYHSEELNQLNKDQFGLSTLQFYEFEIWDRYISLDTKFRRSLRGYVLDMDMFLFWALRYLIPGFMSLELYFPIFPS